MEACEVCYKQCCLAGDNVKSMPRCVELCRDCADIYAQCSQYCSCDSEFATTIAGQCADICEMHVRKNATNSLIWTFAADVRKYARDALIYAEKVEIKI
jgi:hypothetical protein